MATRRKQPETREGVEPSADQLQVRWDDSSVQVEYANVFNVGSTREEVVLTFGVHRGWQREEEEVVVHVSDRMILSPFAAKRLWLMLGEAMRQYEARFGALEVAGQSEPEGAGGGAG